LAAIITFAPAAAFAVFWIWDIGGEDLARVLAAATAVLALFTVYCTAMIYASLRAIPAWANPWTAPGYLALSVMSGALLLNLFSAVWPHGATELVGILTAGAIVLGHVAKALYWSSLRRAAPVSSAESATGLGELGQVRLFEAPHTGPNYLMKEMGFQIARKHAEKLRWIAIISGFLLPMALVLIPLIQDSLDAVALAALAVAFAGIGVAVERWLFFAEARHVQMLYYGESAV
ncbi:MAG: DmsC/YnfH family molybdoenzyme membrane anchor subunit, partial [Sphingomonadales bacterium]